MHLNIFWYRVTVSESWQHIPPPPPRCIPCQCHAGEILNLLKNCTPKTETHIGDLRRSPHKMQPSPPPPHPKTLLLTFFLLPLSWRLALANNYPLFLPFRDLPRRLTLSFSFFDPYEKSAHSRQMLLINTQ